MIISITRIYANSENIRVLSADKIDDFMIFANEIHYIRWHNYQNKFTYGSIISYKIYYTNGTSVKLSDAKAIIYDATDNLISSVTFLRITKNTFPDIEKLFEDNTGVS